jgi:hypothetical protein
LVPNIVGDPKVAKSAPYPHYCWGQPAGWGGKYAPFDK